MRAAVARLDGLGALDAAARATRRSTRSSSTPAATSGSSATATSSRVGHLAAADLAVVVERILAPLGRRARSHQPDRRRPPARRLTRVRRHPARRRRTGRASSVRRFHDRSLGSMRSRRTTLVAVLELLSRGPQQRDRQRGHVLGQDVPAQRHARALPTGRAASSPSRTPPSCCPAADHLVRLEARPATPDGPVADHPGTAGAARRCGCAPIASSSERCAGRRCSPSCRRLNTGHDGSWSTCHANSALDALHRLETLIIQAAPAWPLPAVRRAPDPLDRRRRPRRPAATTARRVVEVGEVVIDRDRLGAAAARRRRLRSSASSRRVRA